ncbi:MAG: GNAT family N-acetyltransferase [Archangium sp.]|nr:GNAT family N-acetyltransferase [Archangium sp.]
MPNVRSDAVMRFEGARLELFNRFREVGAREVAPGVARHDASASFDREAFRRVGASGLFRLHVPREDGGEGLGLPELLAAIEGFAQGSGDLGFSVSVVAHAACFITALLDFGSAEQRARLLPKVMSGEWVAAVANAEPRGGTDVLRLRARATSRGGGYLVHARKRSITNAGVADVIATSVRLDDSSDVSILLLDGAGARVRQRPIRDLMGLRTSPTGDVLAWRAPVSKGAVLGKPGDGVRFFRRVFALERLFIGSLFVATIRRSLHRAVHHAETRLSFGQPIGANQYVQERVVRMRIAEELLSAQVDSTLSKLVAGHDVSASLSIIKTWGVDAARESVEALIALLGGRGLRQGERAEKDLRDVLGLSILGGTQELQKIVIYRETVKALAGAAPAVASRLDDVAIETRDAADVDRSLESALISLVARVFPDEPALKGRYFYDTPPDAVVVARCNGAVVGTRLVSRRSVQVGPRLVRVAGIGIAVDPAFQRRGVGKRLTAEALSLIRSMGDEVVLAFLFSRNAESLLASFGFRRLKAEVSYTHRTTGEHVVEQMPCFVSALAESDAVVSDIEARGSLHLGVGTW